ncbi:MAG: hypothetical protein AAGF87_00005, partial [Bacteroidota bacterium]
DMQAKLELLCGLLAGLGIPSRLRRYLYGDVRYSLRLEADHYLDGPYLLELLVGARPMVVTYELTGTHPFGLLELEHRYAAQEHPKYLMAQDTYDHVSRIRQRLHYSAEAKNMAVFIRQILANQ